MRDLCSDLVRCAQRQFGRFSGNTAHECNLLHFLVQMGDGTQRKNSTARHDASK